MVKSHKCQTALSSASVFIHQTKVSMRISDSLLVKEELTGASEISSFHAHQHCKGRERFTELTKETHLHLLEDLVKFIILELLTVTEDSIPNQWTSRKEDIRHWSSLLHSFR